MTGQRALMAILFTDAVGFSTRAGENEEEALRLLRADFEIMHDTCAGFQGRVLKSTGDGLLMAFDSASQAVDCALEIQRQFAMRPSEHLQHRMGVHLCDVVMEDGDAHGDGVNLAARLEAEASPGGICLSQTIYDIVKSRLPVQAKSLGTRHLKNLVEPVTLFEIAPENAPRGKRIPSGGKRPAQGNALSLAMGFLGVCIVAASLIMANRPQPVAAPPETRTYYVTQREAPLPFHLGRALQERAKTVQPKSTPVEPKQEPRPKSDFTLVSNKPKPEPTTKTAVVTDDQTLAANAAVPNPPAEPAQETPELQTTVQAANMQQVMAEYRQVRETHKRNYDFDAVLGWMEQNEQLKRLPGIQKMESHWRALDELKDKVDAKLKEHSADQPLQVRVPGMPAQVSIWSADGKVMIKGPNGRVHAREFEQIDPALVRAMAVSLTEGKVSPEDRRRLIAFDMEYPNRPRTNVGRNTKAPGALQSRQGENAP